MNKELETSTMQRRLAAQRLQHLTKPDEKTTAPAQQAEPTKKTAPAVALPVVKVVPV